MIALSPFFVRLSFQQTTSNQPLSQPFAFFLLPETQIVNEPFIPVLVAVILPSELSNFYQLSEILVFCENDFVPVYPFLEEPYFDEKSNSFVWLFLGSYEINLEQPINSLNLSVFAFFDSIEPSLSSIYSFDELTLTVDLASFEAKEEKQESKGTDPTGKTISDEGSSGKVQGQSVDKQEVGVSKDSQTISEESAAKEAAKRAIEKDPVAARKLFEQEIATKALSRAKKDPKSTAKGNGLVITVGAYPDVLPADGKSTAFIVVKVTDEKGNPISGKVVNFKSDGGKLLVRQSKTNEEGIAFSRLCSEVLGKGKKKFVTVKAKTNPEAQTTILIDGDATSQSILTMFSTTTALAWCPNLDLGVDGIVCVQGGVIGGGAQGELHIKQPVGGDFYPYLWVNFVKVMGDGHPRQVGLAHPGRLYGGSPHCTPSFTPGKEVVFSRVVGSSDLEWTRFHHGQVSITINYTLAKYTPPWEPPQMITSEVTIKGTAKNAVLRIVEGTPPLLVWDPENPPEESKRKVVFRVESEQTGDVTALVRIYSTARGNSEGAVKEIWVEGRTNENITVVWDGTLDGGGEGTAYADKGLYAYDIQFWIQQQVLFGVDEDRKASPYMTIERAVNENGEQIFEAEYYGYDDKGTEEEEDDEHIYFIRWYVLKCQSAQYDDDGDALVDRDGDEWIKEDWKDGVDNDNDGLIDEDPLGWDEDPGDGQDNDGDGLVDEDRPNPVNASQGEVILYDPDLEPVASWDLSSLLCLEHNSYDGLVASLEGVRHGVLVKVPVSLMQKAGTYRFVLRVWDNHAHLHKDHKVKPALELNALESSVVINLIATDLFKPLLNEAEEENPGAFVHFNLDNDNNSDNNDGAPKHPGGDYIANETHGPVVGEDDLKRAKIFFGRQLGRLPKEGKVVLRVTLISGSRNMRVWKSPEKGAGNDVLVTVQEKGWDLSDPVQRQVFGQIKENLWIEGIEYNSKCWLEVEYKKQEGGQWKVIGSDRVKYTFIAADCGNQPRTDNGQRQRFENVFPDLVRCEWSITAEATDEYNCIAWSVGITDRWIWFEVDSIWGDGDGITESTDFDAFYRNFGYVRTTNINDAEILLYRDPSQADALNPEGITHAAVRRACNCGLGRWIMFESKCGEGERIEHRRDQLNNSVYGAPFRYYKRQ